MSRECSDFILFDSSSSKRARLVESGSHPLTTAKRVTPRRHTQAAAAGKKKAASAGPMETVETEEAFLDMFSM